MRSSHNGALKGTSPKPGWVEPLPDGTSLRSQHAPDILQLRVGDAPYSSRRLIDLPFNLIEKVLVPTGSHFVSLRRKLDKREVNGIVRIESRETQATDHLGRNLRGDHEGLNDQPSRA